MEKNVQRLFLVLIVFVLAISGLASNYVFAQEVGVDASASDSASDSTSDIGASKSTQEKTQSSGGSKSAHSNSAGKVRRSSGVSINSVNKRINPDAVNSNMTGGQLVHLRVETRDKTLYDEHIQVTPCPLTPGSETLVASAYCALVQSGLKVGWSWYGDSVFLESVGGVANNYDLGTYWFWFSDLNFAEESMNAHILEAGEEIILTFNIFPLKMLVSDAGPTVGDTIRVDVLEFGFDTSWNPVWSPSFNSTLLVGNESVLNQTGSYDLQVNSDSSLLLVGQKKNYLATTPVMLSPIPLPIVQNSRHGSGRRLPVAKNVLTESLKQIPQIPQLPQLPPALQPTPTLQPVSGFPFTVPSQDFAVNSAVDVAPAFKLEPGSQLAKLGQFMPKNAWSLLLLGIIAAVPVLLFGRKFRRLTPSV